MDSKIKQDIQKMQRALQEKHPDWSQDKAKWIAMQSLGIL